MNSKKDLNDKLFDVILDEALDLYTQDLVNEEHNPDMTDDEIKLMLEQKDCIYKKVIHNIGVSSKAKYHFSTKKIILIAAIIIVLIALATNASAIKTFVFKVYTQMSGNTLSIGSQQMSELDYDQISAFENKKDIIIPKFLPDNIKLSNITDKSYWVKLRYSNNNDDKWIVLSESVALSEEFGKEVEIRNNDYVIKNCKVLGMETQIVKIQTENKQEMFLCSWCSDNIIYEMSTNCSELDLDAILSSLQYLYK